MESEVQLPFYSILMNALEHKAVGMMQEFVREYESADEQWRIAKTPKFLTDLGEILAVRTSVIYGKTEWDE
jgi:hypothetical protein